jgi:hypothetical protein
MKRVVNMDRLNQDVRHPDIESGEPWPCFNLAKREFGYILNEDNRVSRSSSQKNLFSANPTKCVDITKHYFDVAVSFPGEIRGFVESIVTSLETMIGPDRCFYDNKYKAQLAKPSLDELLQDIYQNRSKLIVVFLCEKYQEKEWCGIELRPIKEIIMERDYEKIMFIKMDEGVVNGVFKTDGYIDGRTHSPKEIAEFIQERISLL